jgi:Holliday junction DNA helicase RuvA
MIAGVRGTLEAKTLDSAYISVGGVTLRVFAPLSVLSEYNSGDQVALQTFLLVREDVLALYGFKTADDRNLFEQLLLVGGVGPRIALALLSSMSAQTFREAILAEDLDRLVAAPGVGKKLAGRLVLELRPRFEKAGFAGMPTGAGGTSTGNVRGQVMEALTGLGYSPSESAAAVRTLPEDATGNLEDLIFQALRSLAKE